MTELRRVHPLSESFSSERAKGWGWVESLHPDDALRVTEGWREAIQARRPYTTEYRSKSDDAYRWTRAQVVPVFEERAVR